MRVLVAGTETAAAHILATGLVASQEEARLGFKTGEVITAMLVDAGDRVQRGQTLAQLDTTELEAAVRQAAAHQERAARDVSRAEKIYDQGVIAEQQAQGIARATDRQTGTVSITLPLPASAGVQ